MTIALRCRCGKLRGQVDTRRVAARAVCYCKDCQAYGRFLATPVLDPLGGTEVAATLPAAVRFDEGLEHLACMSLGPKGLYRWYADCCRTPIGNTPRDPRTSYLVWCGPAWMRLMRNSTGSWGRCAAGSRQGRPRAP